MSINAIRRWYFGRADLASRLPKSDKSRRQCQKFYENAMKDWGI